MTSTRTRRRTLLKTAAAGALVGTVGVSASGSALAPGEIDSLAFDSTASQLNADGESLTDDSLVAVWAAEAATNVDEDGEGDAVPSPDDADIPLVSSDDGVVGFAASIVQNGSSFGYGNEAFVLNVLDVEADGSTVAWCCWVETCRPTTARTPTQSPRGWRRTSDSGAGA